MKCLCIFIYLFLCINTVQAQNAAIDKLNNLIREAKSDTERIRISVDKINKLVEVNIDSAIAFAKNVEKEAERIKDDKGKANVLISIASNYCRKGNYDSALHNLQIAAKISNSLNDSGLIAYYYSVNGMMYGMQGKYDTSIQFYEKSIGIYERHGNVDRLAGSYGNVAIGYQMLSNFPQALFYQQKSLNLAEKQHDVSSQAYTLMNLGNTYQNIGDTAKSEASILKGIELAKSIGVKNVELYGYSNLASLYNLLGKNDKSYDFAMRAASLAKAMGDAGIQAASLAKAAMALGKSKKYDEAIKLDEYAMVVADSSAQPFNIFQAYTTMGSILNLQEKYKEAIPFFEKGFHSLKDADMFDDNVSEMYLELSKCYEKTGDFNKALITFKVASKITDSIRSKDNVQKSTELSMNYDFEKKQNIDRAAQDKKNAEAKFKQVLLMVGLGLTLILAIVAWRAFQNKRKANSLLQTQKEEILSTLSQLKLTQAQLIQSEKMASLGELTAGIAHEIQNPLNFVNNFSELNTELIEEMKNELNADNKAQAILIADNIKENEEKINHHGKRADAIVKGMLQHSRSTNSIKEATDINALADEYLRLSYHGLRAKDKSFNATMETHFDDSLKKINIIPQDVGRVLLNLFTNAFYSVSEKKKLNGKDYEPVVSVTTKFLRSFAGGQGVEIRVKDNGTGIPPEVMDKIFQPFFTTKPTGEGTGLGLSLSYEIIRNGHAGEMKAETKMGEFAEFIIQLPV